MDNNTPRRKPFYILCILVLVVALGLTGKLIVQGQLFGVTYAAPLCKDCNVILVSLDTLSANHLPCYGYNRNTSPFLCAFAKQNIMFSHAYANGTYTFPSHVSMFTGLNPNIHGVNVTFADSFARNIPFLPEILQKNGYTTLFMLPKNDVNLPVATVYNRGIDKIYPEETVSWDQALQDFAQNVDQNKKTFLFLHTYRVHSPYLIGNQPKLYTTDTYPEIPLTLEDYSSTSKEFYQKLYKELQSMMGTENPPSDLDLQYKDAMASIIKDNYNPNLLDSDVLNNMKYFQAIRPWVFEDINYTNNFDIHNPRDVNYLRALYDQRINQLDESQISTIIQFLSSHERIKRSTIVIFTADHGEEFMEHGAIYHQTIYDSNLHIPLIFYIPGVQKPKQIATPVQLTDIAPTILDMLGISHTNEFQGSSLVGEIEGKQLPDRLTITDGYALETMAIRNAQWKLHVKRNADSTFTPYELYDIQKDPNEKQNVLFLHLDIAKDFISRYQSYERIWKAKKKVNFLPS
jgi:arylsulfatase A-like enzyme